MGCGETLVKYILFITNLVFALGGLALLGLGIAAQLQVSLITDLLQGNFEVAPIFTMVIGSVVFVISFFGCCGAIRESNCMLITYTIFMLVLVALKITLSSMIFVGLNDLDNQIPKMMEKSFNVTDRTPFHEMETAFECCGTVGPQSYQNVPLPPSCCPQNGNSTIANPLGCTEERAFPGCNRILIDFMSIFGLTIAIATIAVAAIELVVVVFGCCLANHIRNKERRARY